MFKKLNLRKRKVESKHDKKLGTGVAESAFVANAGGTAVNDDSTFGGYTLQQVVKALQIAGVLE